MSEQENITIVRKSFDNLNNRNLEANSTLVADDVRVEAVGSPSVMNKDQGRIYTHRFIEAFPDLKFELRDLIAQGDKVAASWVARGTHRAPLITADDDTIPATNNKVSLPGVTIFHLRNNLITRQEIYWDQMSFMSQLGLLTEELLSTRSRR